MSIQQLEGNNYIWALKYRPTTIDELILPNNLKQRLKQIVERQQIPNLLFNGQAGIGKTSSAYVLAKEFEAKTLYINGSLNTSIDVVRQEVIQFASTKSFDNTKKIVIMDECLAEDEEVLVNTPEGIKPLALKDFELGKVYEIVSFNMNTEQIEIDKGEIISDKEDYVYEIELEDGRTIQVTEEHPFLVRQKDSTIVEKSIRDGLKEGEIIVSSQTNIEKIEEFEIKSIKPIGKKKVRNLTVYKNHTFITKNGIITHNCDRLSPNAQDSLKTVLETHSKVCSFIFLTNHKERIIEPLKSRVEIIDFIFTDKQEILSMKKQLLKRLITICEQEQVKYTKENLKKLIQKYFPDMRKILIETQKLADNDMLNKRNLMFQEETQLINLIDVIKSKNYSKLCKYVAALNMDAGNFYSWFEKQIPELIKQGMKKDYLGWLIILINKYAYESYFVADQTINIKAFLMELMTVDEKGLF